MLNGPPRSGKSSIVKVIQETFEGPWMNLGVDIFSRCVTPLCVLNRRAAVRWAGYLLPEHQSRLAATQYPDACRQPGPLASFAMAKTMPVPDLDALGDFALAAARNARRLLDDAELLLKRGRSPSAYSLAVLAFEEAGKAWMCVVAMMVPDDVRPEWPYGDLITRHVDKLLAAHVMAHMLASASSGQDVIASLVDIGDSLEEL